MEWVDKRRRGHYPDFSPSTGEARILTFDTPLEFFIEEMTPEKMGDIVLEALDRSEQMENKVNRKKSDKKKITLLDGTRLSIPIPSNRRFADEEDGVGEVYQLYSYYPDALAEEPVAMYYLGMAGELSCDLSHDNIQNVWEELYGNPDTFEIKEEEKGIFSMRVEMRNKQHHRISYLLKKEEDFLLECTMDVVQPNRRKKTDEKLALQFEKFVEGCQYV